MFPQSWDDGGLNLSLYYWYDIFLSENVQYLSTPIGFLILSLFYFLYLFTFLFLTLLNKWFLIKLGIRKTICRHLFCNLRGNDRYFYNILSCKYKNYAHTRVCNREKEFLQNECNESRLHILPRIQKQPVTITCCVHRSYPAFIKTIESN